MSAELYECHDLFLAAWLKAKQVPFKGFSKDRVSEGKPLTLTFLFEREPSLSETILQFENDDFIGGKTLCNAIRDVWTMVKQARNHEGGRP